MVITSSIKCVRYNNYFIDYYKTKKDENRTETSRSGLGIKKGQTGFKTVYPL